MLSCTDWLSNVLLKIKLYQNGKKILPPLLYSRSSIAPSGSPGECTGQVCGGTEYFHTPYSRNNTAIVSHLYSVLRRTVSYEHVQTCDTRHYCQFSFRFFSVSFCCTYRVTPYCTSTYSDPLQVPDDQSMGRQSLRCLFSDDQSWKQGRILGMEGLRSFGTVEISIWVYQKIPQKGYMHT